MVDIKIAPRRPILQLLAQEQSQSWAKKGAVNSAADNVHFIREKHADPPPS
jgi:hypothetical protein